MTEKGLRRVCLAPMIDYTDRHFRYFIRLISKHIYLYTEMVTAQAINHGDHDHLLAFDPKELPLALQLGGSDPKLLAEAAKIGESYGYSEINLNVGCPSDRVQAGRFGACLMKEPQLVAECVAEMQHTVSIPVTVKCRLGVDNQDSYKAFYDFISIVGEAPCHTFIVHARKAWLKGLSPKQNRTIPPLMYEYVHQIKKDFSTLEIIINGGIKDLDAEDAFNTLDGIMIGREAYHNPYHLIDVDRRFYGDDSSSTSRVDALQGFSAYIQNALGQGVKLHHILKHLAGLSHGIAGGAKWRRNLNKPSNHTFQDYQSLIDTFPSELVKVL